MILLVCNLPTPGVQFSRSVVSDSLWPHGLQQARSPCPSPIPRACSNSHQSSQSCHPTISSSVVPFSSCPPSFPAAGSFPTSQFFTPGGQRIGVSASASVLQDWFPFGSTKHGPLEKGMANHFSILALRTPCESHSGMSDSLWLHGYPVHGILQARMLGWVTFPGNYPREVV